MKSSAEQDQRLNFEYQKTHVKTCNVHNENIVAFHEIKAALIGNIYIVLEE